MQIDARGPRFGAAITMVVLLLAIYFDSPILLSFQTLVWAIGAFAGPPGGPIGRTSPISSGTWGPTQTIGMSGSPGINGPQPLSFGPGLVTTNIVAIEPGRVLLTRRCLCRFGSVTETGLVLTG